MARLPRVNALLLGVLRASDPPEGLTLGSRIPAHMLLPFAMVHRTGGASIHPDQADQPIVSARSWADNDAQAEANAQWIRDALYRASRAPQLRVPGVGYINFFDEVMGPREMSGDLDDHDTYCYQATYSITTRPDRG